MAINLLTEVKRLEKQLNEILAAVAIESKGKPMPPEGIKLCKMGQMLMEVRTGLEKGPDEAAAAEAEAKSRRDAGDWGTAFRGGPSGPPTPSGEIVIEDAWKDMLAFEEP